MQLKGSTLASAGSRRGWPFITKRLVYSSLSNNSEASAEKCSQAKASRSARLVCRPVPRLMSLPHKNARAKSATRERDLFAHFVSVAELPRRNCFRARRLVYDRRPSPTRVGSPRIRLSPRVVVSRFIIIVQRQANVFYLDSICDLARVGSRAEVYNVK